MLFNKQNLTGLTGLLRRALEAEADRVLEAATGREGIDTAAAERPDLIVLDLGLPDMPGADVCRDIRGWSSVPILVLSARHSDLEKAALLDSGADDYMTKCAHDHCCSRACFVVLPTKPHRSHRSP